MIKRRPHISSHGEEKFVSPYLSQNLLVNSAKSKKIENSSIKFTLQKSF
jgi:hypothetical protein